MMSIRKVCQKENKLIREHCSELVADTECRSLSWLVQAFEEGSLCSGRNEFATWIVRCLGLADGECVDEQLAF